MECCSYTSVVFWAFYQIAQYGETNSINKNYEKYGTRLFNEKKCLYENTVLKCNMNLENVVRMPSLIKRHCVYLEYNTIIIIFFLNTC